VNSYLSVRHRDGAGRGCAIPSLAAEAVRQPAPVRAAFTKGLRDFVDILATFVIGRGATREGVRHDERHGRHDGAGARRE